MISSSIAALVDFSRRFAALIVILALILSVALGHYVVHNIAINTDINQLMSDKLDWKIREKKLDTGFPQHTDNLIVVIDGDTVAKAEFAAAALAKKLSAMPDHFTLVTRPDALPYFRKNALLLMPVDELAATLDQITQVQPMLGAMTSDPSLRGFFNLITLMTQGAQAGAMSASQIERPLTAVTNVVTAQTDGRNEPLDWQKMMPAAQDQNSSALKLRMREFIITKPVLDYASLQPGEASTKILRQAVSDLGLTPENGVRVRLTGSVALNDQEFASVAQGTGGATILSGVLVLVLLFFAMRTWRIIIPIALTLVVGLIASTAFATFAVGSLNLISVAFAVMFIGIAVDFGIQFGVRYRDQHHLEPDHVKALSRTAKIIAIPLSMAAGSTALGFLSFIPTAYRGVSELGVIAGGGMIIAFILNLTLLPALMTLIKTPAEQETIGYAKLAPLNDFLLSKRKILLPFIAVLTLAAFIITCGITFDFDPLDLKDTHTESVSTMFDVMQDPASDAYAAQILTPSLQAAQDLAAKLEKLPEVDHAMTLASFVPDNQGKKRAMIADTSTLLAPSFSLPKRPMPDFAENLDALRKASVTMHQAGGAIPAAQALAVALDVFIGHATPQSVSSLQSNIVAPMQDKLKEIHAMLNVNPLSIKDIPDQLRHDWVTADGQYLVEVFPKRGADNNPRDLKMLRQFIDAVRQVAPDVSGTPVSIRESGRTIVSAFVHAGIYGLVSIGLLALLILRRLCDVMLMLTPLLIAGVLTLATITLIGLPLNFANIIALPLLLSLGVSYAVYFVSYWRSGHQDLLQSSMARAVLFSAGTVLVAFISLCFSAHPGTRGMGELLTIALLYSLICTFLLLPVLLGFDKRYD